MPSDDSGTNRRSILKYAGAAAAAALAGCSGGGGDGGDTATDTETATATETDMGDTATPTETDDGDTATPTETDDGTPQMQEFPVTITQGQMPTTLDPQNHRSTPTDNVVLHVYEGLLTRDRSGKIVNELATGYERLERGRVRFTIRDGPTFHSGNDLTPEDVAYSINRIVKKSVGIASPQSDQLAGVQGAELAEGRQVDVNSNGLNPIVFSLFASFCDVMEKAWVQNNEQSYIAQNMNGTGPFQLKNYQPDVQVVLERNTDYWKEPAAISELTFRAAKESSTRVNQLIEDETDLIVNVPPQEVPRVEDSDARIAAVPSTRIIYNAMRYDVEPFDSPKFRQAMNYAVDLQGIVDNILSGFGAQTGQPTLQGFLGHNPDVEPYSHDPDKAEQLVEESGYAGATITLHTPVGRYLKDVEIAQSVVNQINQLGNVNAELQQREFATLAGLLVDGDIETGPPFYLIGWGNSTFDASQTIIPLLTSDGALTSYKNPEIDEMVNRAQDTGNSDKRDQIYQKVNRRYHEESPWIFLNRQFSVYGVSSRLQWEPRRDERIDAYAITPA